MYKTLAVAWREFKHTALTKAFLLAAVIMPMLMFAAAFVLPFVLEQPPEKLEGTLAVVDRDGALIESVRTELDVQRMQAEQDEKLARLTAALEQVPERFRGPIDDQLDRMKEQLVPEVELRHEPPEGLERIKQQARDGDLLGAAVFDPAVLGTVPADNHFELFITPGLSRRHVDLIQDALARAVVRARAERAEIDLEATRALLDRPDAITSTLTAKGEARENELLRQIVPFIFMVLLWMSSWVSGNYLLTTTIEEKSNRVMEVLLSAVSPMQLMTGKILGQAFVGLVMLSVYASVGAVSAGRFGFGHLVPPQTIGYLALYFFMAYFMVAALMAAVGSAVNELRDAQSLMGPITLVYMVPFFVWFVISDQPNSPLATGLSFVPLITPFVMILRVTGSEPVPTWEILSTLVLGIATVVGMVWLSAKVFRVGLLMYGKPPTPRELLKWVRYS